MGPLSHTVGRRRVRLSTQIATTEGQEDFILALGCSRISLACVSVVLRVRRALKGLPWAVRATAVAMLASASGLSSACRHLHLPAGGVGGGGRL